MIVSVKGQAVLFMITVILGFSIGFLYDIIRVIRKIVPHSNFFIQIEDLIYWVFVSMIMFAIMLQKNYGEIRAFTIIGAFIGMILYFLTVSHLFMKVSLTIFDFIKKIVYTLLEIMLFPIKLLIKPLKYPYFFIIKIIKNISKSAKKKYNSAKNTGKVKSKKISNKLKIRFKKN